MVLPALAPRQGGAVRRRVHRARTRRRQREQRRRRGVGTRHVDEAVVRDAVLVHQRVGLRVEHVTVDGREVRIDQLRLDHFAARLQVVEPLAELLRLLLELGGELLGVEGAGGLRELARQLHGTRRGGRERDDVDRVVGGPGDGRDLAGQLGAVGVELGAHRLGDRGAGHERTHRRERGRATRRAASELGRVVAQRLGGGVVRVRRADVLARPLEERNARSDQRAEQHGDEQEFHRPADDARPVDEIHAAGPSLTIGAAGPCHDPSSGSVRRDEGKSTGATPYPGSRCAAAGGRSWSVHARQRRADGRRVTTASPDRRSRGRCCRLRTSPHPRASSG